MSLSRRRLILASTATVITSLGFVQMLGAAASAGADALATATPCVTFSQATRPFTQPPTTLTPAPTTAAPTTVIQPPTTVPPSTTVPPTGTTPTRPGPTHPTPPGPNCGGFISGQLLDNGRPLSGVDVTAESVRGPFSRRSVTDADGRYRLTGVPTGANRVRFTFPGNVVQYHPSVRTAEQATLVTVAAFQEIVVNETVMPHGSVRGTVVHDDGEPVGFAQVRLEEVDTGIVYPLYSEGGTFAYPVVPLSRYRLAVEYDSNTQYSVRQRTEATARIYQVVAGGDIVVTEGLLPLGTLSGTYRRPDGSPGVGLEVNLYTPSGVLKKTTYIDNDGRFAADVFAGQYIVEFRRPSGQVEYWRQSATRAGARPVTVPADGSVSIAMTGLPDGTVSGILTRADGQPVDYAEVTLIDPRTDWAQAVDVTAGTWQFPGILPGTYRIRFNDFGHVQWAVGRTSARSASPIVVRAGRTTVVNDTLLAPGTLTVLAYDRAAGSAVADFCAEIWTEGMITSRCSAGDPAGVTFDRLGAGTYTMTVTATEGTATTTVTVRSGQSGTVRVAVD
jgi:hypothetical protein